MAKSSLAENFPHDDFPSPLESLRLHLGNENYNQLRDTFGHAAAAPFAQS